MQTLRLAALAALLILVLATASSQAAAPVPRASQNSEYDVPLPYLTPIPIVRLVGRTTNTGVRITLLRVRAPRGSTVTLRCRGGRRRGCRVANKTRTAPPSRFVRFREVERRLKAGVRIELFVRRGETIGKYTTFKIRKKKAPVRRDACLFPGDPFEPIECP